MLNRNLFLLLLHEQKRTSVQVDFTKFGLIRTSHTVASPFLNFGYEILILSTPSASRLKWIAANIYLWIIQNLLYLNAP